MVFLSGSQGRARKVVAEAARQTKERGVVVVAVTGGNDHHLTRQARLTILVPDLVELPASILSLALAGWLGRELATSAPEGRLSRLVAVGSRAQADPTMVDNRS